MELTAISKTKSLRNIALGILATSVVACGASATPQLADARRAYSEAESSPARTRAPHALAEAKTALDRAEQAHEDDPGSAEEVHLAERAEHKANIAEARGEARVTAHDRVVVEPARPVDTRDRDYEREHAARVYDREHRPTRKQADAALQSLAKVASVKEESRGVVVTLSGSLLFPSGKEDVSPIANDSLDQVAHALAQQPNDTTFQVEGYTDSSGSEDENRKLSTQRAHAVADRLASEGIDAARISAVGRGESNPVADNDTSAGRASNRRVEIVVDRGRK
jgi:outer membrane protein OmpA-like peptidoglycan-associated protein